MQLHFSTKLIVLSFPQPDKHPQLNEFLAQIKNTPDLANLFESIQKDANSSPLFSSHTSGGGVAAGGADFQMDLS